MYDLQLLLQKNWVRESFLKAILVPYMCEVTDECLENVLENMNHPWLFNGPSHSKSKNSFNENGFQKVLFILQNWSLQSSSCTIMMGDIQIWSQRTVSSTGIYQVIMVSLRGISWMGSLLTFLGQVEDWIKESRHLSFNIKDPFLLPRRCPSVPSKEIRFCPQMANPILCRIHFFDAINPFSD